MSEVLASKLGIAAEELSFKLGDVKESGGPTWEPDSTVEDEILEDLDTRWSMRVPLSSCKGRSARPLVLLMVANHPIMRARLPP